MIVLAHLQLFYTLYNRTQLIKVQDFFTSLIAAFSKKKKSRNFTYPVIGHLYYYFAKKPFRFCTKVL